MAQRDTRRTTSWIESWLEGEVIQPIQDFEDPKQEWRRLFSELFGTFFLVFVAAGGGMMGQAFPDIISRTAAVVAPGLMVMAIILFMGKVPAPTSTRRSASPSPSVVTPHGEGSPGTSSCSSPGRRWPPGSSSP
jgi:hypothetical protein